MAHKVWDMAVAHQWLLNLPFTQPVSSLREELHSLAYNDYPRFSRVVLLLRSIWKFRNALVFRNEISSPMGTLLLAKRSWAEWTLRTSPPFYPSTIPSSSPYHTHPLPKSTQFIGWKLPHGGFIKINFDGSKSSMGVAAGFVIRNWQGGFIMAGSRFMEQAPIIVAEATAMRVVLAPLYKSDFVGLKLKVITRLLLKQCKSRLTHRGK